jgi:hypothetical protein
MSLIQKAREAATSVRGMRQGQGEAWLKGGAERQGLRQAGQAGGHGSNDVQGNHTLVNRDMEWPHLSSLPRLLLVS